MSAVSSAALTTAGLIGGYSTARATGNRPLGGAVLAAFGAAAFEATRRRSGVGSAVAVTGTYVAAFGLSHPLAKKIGAWPAVLSMTAVSAAVAMAAGERGGA